jgi:predicted CXXCH cytochrome family protein
MKKVLLAVTLVAGMAAAAQAASIVNTKHDLSSGNTGANSIHSSSTNQTCVFCHAPHNAVTAKLLWNRNAVEGSTMKIYTSYNTSAMRAKLSQSSLGNDSSSLLCLSCHSLGSAAAVITNTTGGSTWATVTGNNSTFPSKTGNMTNLTNDHPVGIDYDAAVSVVGSTGLVASSNGKVGALRLFKSNVSGSSTMECASCHSVHDNTNGKFLAASNSQSALCTVCHVK